MRPVAAAAAASLAISMRADRSSIVATDNHRTALSCAHQYFIVSCPEKLGSLLFATNNSAKSLPILNNFNLCSSHAPVRVCVRPYLCTYKN